MPKPGPDLSLKEGHGVLQLLAQVGAGSVLPHTMERLSRRSCVHFCVSFEEPWGDFCQTHQSKEDTSHLSPAMRTKTTTMMMITSTVRATSSTAATPPVKHSRLPFCTFPWSAPRTETEEKKKMGSCGSTGWASWTHQRRGDDKWRWLRWWWREADNEPNWERVFFFLDSAARGSGSSAPHIREPRSWRIWGQKTGWWGRCRTVLWERHKQ